MSDLSFDDLTALLADTRAGRVRPMQVVERVLELRARGNVEGIWIHRAHGEELLARGAALEQTGPAGMKLYGVPFAVKDNIDVAGWPTTAGCPAYSYVPDRSAPVVERLLDEGAILVGKTNLDQFATGLTGTRSPYGIPRNPVDPDYIAGGSSSGSACAVAHGLVSFALGTDTAGSGRVPAAFCGLVGLKPTRGRLSTEGVVPACRSLDCVSVFTRTAADASLVLAVADGLGTPGARRGLDLAPPLGAGFRFGAVPEAQLETFGDDETAELYRAAVASMEAIGGIAEEIDYEPLRRVAELLYGGAWVAERYAAVGDFVESERERVEPTVGSIIRAAGKLEAHRAFQSCYALEDLRRQIDPMWERLDALVVPTTPTHYRVDEVLADPLRLNSRLGYYTNFMNLLDLSGVAVPAGTRAGGLPFGVTLAAPAGHDEALLGLAHRLEGGAVPLEAEAPARARAEEPIALAVVGAHLRGQPLHHQLEEQGARFLRATRTSEAYRLYALAGTSPPKPGLEHVGGDGVSIEVEVYALPPAGFGRFVAAVPRPLAIGRVELEDGGEVSGFVCEPEGLMGAEDISRYGGWRAFLADRGEARHAEA